MAQLMKQTLVFGAGVVGLSALTQVASADAETKPMTPAEVRAENAKRIAAYESEKREIDERNRVKRAQYRDAYAHYAEFATRGATEPKEPDYEALPTLELLEEPVESPFDIADVTPHESTFEHNDKVVNSEAPNVTPSETDKTDDASLSNATTSETNETTEKVSSDTTGSGIKGTVNNELPNTGVLEKETGKKDAEPSAVTSEAKETGKKEGTSSTASPETKETGEKEDASSAATPETKETGEKTSSDAVAAQLNAEKTSSDAVAAQLNKESEKTTTSSADAAAQISKIESEKTSDTTESETPPETTSSSDAANQVAKLEAEKSANAKSEDSTPTTKSDTDTSKTDKVENNDNQARNLSNTAEKSNNPESTTKDKSQESLPHTGDSGSLVSLLGVALSGLGTVSLRRKQK